MILVLSQRNQLSENLWEYLFTPTQPIHWRSGQFIGLKLPGLSDQTRNWRHFTIATHSGVGVIRVLTRHGASQFKQALAALPLDAVVNMSEAPAGTFTWKQPTQAKILCAAGVGVTPFLAMLEDPQTPLDAAPVTLVYGHPATPLPDAKQLKALASRHAGFTIIELDHRPTAASLSSLKLNLSDSLVYTAGIKDHTRLMLPPINLPTRQLMTDEFTGYAAADY